MFLGPRQLPREITAFELEAFFQFSAAERRVIEGRRRAELKLGLALRGVLLAIAIGIAWIVGTILGAVHASKGVRFRHRFRLRLVQLSDGRRGSPSRARRERGHSSRWAPYCQFQFTNCRT